MASPAPEHAEEPEAFAALDAYLEALHSGRPAERARLLSEHPHLAAFVDCLDSLDRLAPAGFVSPFHAAATLSPPSDSPAPSPQAPATRFGMYELLGELVRGGWLRDHGDDDEHGRLYAVGLQAQGRHGRVRSAVGSDRGLVADDDGGLVRGGRLRDHGSHDEHGWLHAMGLQAAVIRAMLAG